jgi:hypothetical protein
LSSRQQDFYTAVISPKQNIKIASNEDKHSEAEMITKKKQKKVMMFLNN